MTFFSKAAFLLVTFLQASAFHSGHHHSQFRRNDVVHRHIQRALSQGQASSQDGTLRLLQEMMIIKESAPRQSFSYSLSYPISTSYPTSMSYPPPFSMSMSYSMSFPGDNDVDEEDDPVTPRPGTPSPVTASPETPSPVTPAPVTPSPASRPPTSSPTTSAPTTSSPTTSSPTTSSPSTSKNDRGNDEGDSTITTDGETTTETQNSVQDNNSEGASPIESEANTSGDSGMSGGMIALIVGFIAIMVGAAIFLAYRKIQQVRGGSSNDSFLMSEASSDVTSAA